MKRNSTLRTRVPLRAKKPWRVKAKPMKRSALKTRSTLKTSSTGLKKTRLKKIGKVGRSNVAARKKIAEIAEKKQMKLCELGPVLLEYGIDVCTKTWPLAPAHKHKRAWYQGDEELLADPKEWVCACQSCHDVIEHDEALTEYVFSKLRK